MVSWKGRRLIAHFDRELFRFLKGLRANNDRDWFKHNRQRYEAHVRQPLLGFIVGFSPLLAKISGHFSADPRPVGGSMFRIHRDTRFAKDKSPYKTMAAAQFRHEQGKDVHAPGFYVHLEPGACFVGIGIWRPEGPIVRQIRDAMVDDPDAWLDAARAEPFSSRYALEGERLKRPPRGYDPESPSGLDRHGSPNVLTIDKGTSKLAQAPSSHTTLVDVEKVEETVADVGIFEPPVVESR